MVQVHIVCPYPQNLLLAVFGVEDAPKTLPPDIEASVEHALVSLDNERSAQIIRLRFRDGCTLEKIGLVFSITKERVRQIIVKTLHRLRHPSRAVYLLHGRAELERLAEQRIVEKYGEDCAALLRREAQTGFSGVLMPLHDIPNPYDRANAVLQRSRFQTVEEINLPFRCYTALRRSDITHVWQICFLTPKAVTRLKGIGRRICSLTRETLLPMGLDMDDGLLSGVPGLEDYARQRCRMWEKTIVGAANSKDTGGICND